MHGMNVSERAIEALPGLRAALEQRTVMCIKCAGRGKHPLLDGKHHRNPNPEVTCDKCHGSGVVPDPAFDALRFVVLMPCPNCKGGKYRVPASESCAVDTWHTCSRCKGTGSNWGEMPEGSLAGALLRWLIFYLSKEWAFSPMPMRREFIDGILYAKDPDEAAVRAATSVLRQAQDARR